MSSKEDRELCVRNTVYMLLRPEKTVFESTVANQTQDSETSTHVSTENILR